eukprot:jgi/Chlat1/6024/Chrsp4S06325
MASAAVASCLAVGTVGLVAGAEPAARRPLRSRYPSSSLGPNRPSLALSPPSPARAPRQSRHGRLPIRCALGGGGDEGEEVDYSNAQAAIQNEIERRRNVAANATTTTPANTGEVSSVGQQGKPKQEGFVKGQFTAILTGAFAVLLGVGYLLLVQLLDTRGVNLIPPPDEAFRP